MVCSLGRCILSASTMRFLSGSCHPDNHAEDAKVTCSVRERVELVGRPAIMTEREG
jgi:hypothetical protein